MVKILISCAEFRKFTGIPWDSRPKLLHLPLMLETLGVYLFPKRIMAVSFFKKKTPWHQLTRMESKFKWGAIHFQFPQVLQPPPPGAINLKVIDGPVEALSIRVMLTTAQENLQFLGRTENAQVVPLDVHDWCDHGDTKEVGLKLAQENILVEKCMSISVERTKYVEVLYLQSQRRFTWQLTPTFSYPSVLIPGCLGMGITTVQYSEYSLYTSTLPCNYCIR